MAKVMTIGFENMNTMATVEGVLKAMGVKYLVKEVEARSEKAEAKAETSTKKAPKAKAETPKAEKKGADDFDYELYRAISEQLGVYGKHGCYRFARPTVKGLMQHPEYLTKAGKLQAKVKKSALATLLTEAQKLGLQWYIDSVAQAQ